jgi:hypothetical protein
MKMVVELKGAQYDLEYLSSILSTSTLCITRVEKLNKHVLWHCKFDSVQEVSGIYECAKNLIGVINGCAKLRNKNFSATKLVDEFLTVETSKGVYEIEDADHINVTVFPSTTTVVADVGRTQQYKSNLIISKNDPTHLKVVFDYTLLNTAMEDEKVEEALRYFANMHDWFNLYKIFEAIEKDPKDSMGRAEIKRIDGSDKKSEKKSNRFSQTANYYRHHRDLTKFRLPKQPMSLEEADDYIEELMKVWCFRKTYNTEVTTLYDFVGVATS